MSRVDLLRMSHEGDVCFVLVVEKASASSLSRAEIDVAQLAGRGMSNAEIARIRSTSARTVANQLASIFRKLGVQSRSELAARFARGSESGVNRSRAAELQSISDGASIDPDRD